MADTRDTSAVHSAPESPWKTWAPAMVGLAGLVLSMMVQTHQAGSGRLVDQIAKLTEQTTKLTEQVATVCAQMTKNDQRFQENDKRMNEYETTQARILQRLGMSN